MNKKIVITIIAFAIFLLAACSSKNQSTVSVSGIGAVLVQPDMVLMNINFSHIAQTTREAKNEVDNKMRQVMGILKDEEIEDKNIKTVSLSYDVETEYRNGRSVWIGQRAQQAIVVTINDIVNNPNKLPALLDKITAIDRVSIQNIMFDTESKTELFEQSRELAYQKALDKANQYAQLSGQKIVKALTISEERSRDVLSKQNVLGNVLLDTVASYDASSSIPTGEQEVRSEVMVTFLLK